MGVGFNRTDDTAYGKRTHLARTFFLGVETLRPFLRVCSKGDSALLKHERKGRICHRGFGRM